MKLSIITVSYNSAATIAATLRSVASQTYGDVEHVIIDGASRDSTLEVVRECGQRVSTVISEPDSGIYDAMNKGVRLARGEIIAFLNSDDYYAHDGVLADVARAFDGRTDAVFGDVGFFRPERPDRLLRRYRASRFTPERLARGFMPPHPALFVRAEVFDRVGSFVPEYRIAGDFEWIARAFGPRGIRHYRHVPQVMVRMRMGGVSTAGWRNTLLLNREVMRACRANGIATSWPKLLSKYPAKMLEFVVR